MNNKIWYPYEVHSVRYSLYWMGWLDQFFSPFSFDRFRIIAGMAVKNT